MKKLSAVIIVKDGQDLIKDCIKSINFCDEIIVVDSGSKDKTVSLSKELGAKIFEVTSDDFSYLRNYGLRMSTSDLVFYIDADERVDEILKIAICELKNIDEVFSAFVLKRKNFYLGNNEWPYIEKIERIFVKNKLKGWEGKLHEHPVVEGKKKTLSGHLLHYTHRDLTSMLNKTIEWSKTEAMLRYNANHPRMTWWRFPRIMLTAFFNYYIKQGGYKIGTVGLIESIYQSFSMFITYARLWEMQNKHNKITNN